MKTMKRFILAAAMLVLAAGAFGVDRNPTARDVNYTTELYSFIDAYYNHQITGDASLKSYYDAAVASASSFADDYSKKVHLARCEYYYGMKLMETYDVSNMTKIDVNDTGNTESVNSRAGKYFDNAISYAQQALKIKAGTDAYAIHSQAISANCTAKSVAYVIGNGLSVGNIAKKAIKADPKNGNAAFLAAAQDIYAPKPFDNITKGRNAMLKILDDSSMVLESFDKFNIYSSIGFSYMRQNNNDEARAWFKKCQAIYPQNYSVKQFLSQM